MKNDEEVLIHDVSDTALWVAYHRAVESERPNALFRDPFAKILAGDRGREIAKMMWKTARRSEWSVIVRTVVIDNFIEKLVEGGVDTVVNLGAGLDTRPYRLSLPPHLRWIEVDYEKMIRYKEKILIHEKPQVLLERIPLDLSMRDLRRKVFRKIASESKKVLILTEGVIPYLTEEQVANLAEDLKAEASFCFWIAEYFSSDVYKYFRNPERAKKMKNALFYFFPQNWFEFFKLRGWEPSQIRYLGEEGEKWKRWPPMTLWQYLLWWITPLKKAAEWKKLMAYVVYTPSRR